MIWRRTMVKIALIHKDDQHWTQFSATSGNRELLLCTIPRAGGCGSEDL